MKQPKISKELLRLVYSNYDVYWNTSTSEYMVINHIESIHHYKSVFEVAHDMKVFFSENIEKYGVILDEKALAVNILERGTLEGKLKDFWCDEEKILFDPQRVFDASEWIVNNYNKKGEKNVS